MDVRDVSGQRSLKLRWLRPDYSLSSGLCHGRCACMAGHQNLNKKYLFCGPEGRSHGSCPGSPLLSVVLVCVGVILRFCWPFARVDTIDPSDLHSKSASAQNHRAYKPIHLQFAKGLVSCPADF